MRNRNSLDTFSAIIVIGGDRYPWLEWGFFQFKIFSMQLKENFGLVRLEQNLWDRIWAQRQGFEPCGQDLGLEAGIWALKLGKR